MQGRAAALRPTTFLVAALALTAVAGVAAIALARLADGERSAASDRAAGCELRKASYGYPDWYLSRQLIPTVHPPVVAAGWRGPREPVEADVLFHSIFHGYLVVQYRPDLAPARLAVLRGWVRGHTRRRVTSAPAPAGFPFAVHVGRWGYELRCASAAALTERRLDRFLALPRPAP